MEAAAGGQRRENHGVAEVGGDRRHRRVIHAGLELQTFGDAQYVVDDAAMLDADALGTARRATRVDHIGEVPGLDPGLVLSRRRRVGPVECVQTNRLRDVGRQTSNEAALREQHPDVRICQHECDPFEWIRRIDGHVRRARLQDAEYAHHHLQRALDEQAHQHVRPNTQPSQMMRQAVGPTVEFAVGHPLVLEHHGHLTRGAPGLCLDEVVQTGILRGTRRGGVLRIHRSLLEGVYRDHAISSFMISFAPA